MRRFLSRLLVWLVVSASVVFVVTPANAAACTGTTGTSGSYALMKFTAAQTNCTWNIPAGVSSVDVLIVGGGGGAGFGNLGGGGGAGQVLYSINPLMVSPGDTVTLTVGNYGTGGYNSVQANWAAGTSGETSSVVINSNTYSAVGGGGGGGGAGPLTGRAGGSGGGAANGNTTGASVRNSYAGFIDTGFPGGTTSPGTSGSGGGGAGGPGSGSSGGTGVSMWGLSFAGGGGGWPSGSGGSGGGGSAQAGIGTSDHGNVGTDGTGSGGGGGERGGTGLIVFRYLVDSTPPTLSSANVPTSGASVILIFSETISAVTAPTGAFSVTTNGSVDTVSSITVSGTQVTLNLQIQVTSALTVLVSYTDPSAGNDINALQDPGFNDVATFTNQSVTNNSTTKTPVTISATLSGDGKNAVYRATSTITVITNTPGKARFTILGKPIPGCQSITAASVSTYYQAICSWKPSVHSQVVVNINVTPSNSAYVSTGPQTLTVSIAGRSGKR